MFYLHPIILSIVSSHIITLELRIENKLKQLIIKSLSSKYSVKFFRKNEDQLFFIMDPPRADGPRLAAGYPWSLQFKLAKPQSTDESHAL